MDFLNQKRNSILPLVIWMIDACHIYPFSISNDDTVSNGIDLYLILHRAFDRGLISITEDYKVNVSGLVNDKGSEFTLSQFEGKKIFLPKKDAWQPSIESLRWHRNEVYLK